MSYEIGQTFEKFDNDAHIWALKNDATVIFNESKGLYEIVAVEISEEEKQAQTLAKAKADRAESVSKITVKVDGMTFDGDEESQTRMGRTISAAIALGVDLQTYKQVWILADNTIAEVTIAQLAQALKLAGEVQTKLWVVPYQEG